MTRDDLKKKKKKEKKKEKKEKKKSKVAPIQSTYSLQAQLPSQIQPEDPVLVKPQLPLSCKPRVQSQLQIPHKMNFSTPSDSLVQPSKEFLNESGYGLGTETGKGGLSYINSTLSFSHNTLINQNRIKNENGVEENVEDGSFLEPKSLFSLGSLEIEFLQRQSYYENDHPNNSLDKSKDFIYPISEDNESTEPKKDDSNVRQRSCVMTGISLLGAFPELVAQDADQKLSVKESVNSDLPLIGLLDSSLMPVIEEEENISQSCTEESENISTASGFGLQRYPVYEARSEKIPSMNFYPYDARTMPKSIHIMQEDYNEDSVESVHSMRSRMTERGRVNFITAVKSFGKVHSLQEMNESLTCANLTSEFSLNSQINRFVSRPFTDINHIAECEEYDKGNTFDARYL